jgi:imidazolonepropionase-like amidohydrolase
MRISMALLFLIVALPRSIAQTSTPICITNVTVVDVKTGKLLPGQHVIIQNDRIATIGAAKKTKIPTGASVVDGAGKFLMPGMTDAHIHFFQSGGLYTRPDALNLGNVYSYEKDQQWIKDNLSDLMARYLACGITSVIDVGGPFSNYSVREKLAGDSKSPTAFVTGPLISTYQPPNLDPKDPPIIKVASADEARELVRKQLPYKPDFIKIWYIVLPNQTASSTLPIIEATIDESHKNGLKVAVHATEYETAKLAVNAGADILVHSIDDKVLDKEMLQLLSSKKVAYIPTMIVAQNYVRTFTQQFDFTAHDFKYANPFMLGTLQDIMHLEKLPFNYKTIRSRYLVPSKDDSTIATNIKLAQQAGVLIVAGTDAGNIGTQHASSFQDELLAMQKAGLSNKEILASATINMAAGFGKDSLYGSVEKGKIADLLLLDKDPLQDINIPANLNTIFRRGVIIKPGELVNNTPEMLAQQQLNAYNLRNIDAFLEPYSDSVEIYDFTTGKLMMKGKEQMRKSYSNMFKNTPELHCKLVNRIVEGNTVIDQESVTGWGDKPATAIAVYKIEKGKIAKVYFIQ